MPIYHVRVALAEARRLVAVNYHCFDFTGAEQRARLATDWYPLVLRDDAAPAPAPAPIIEQTAWGWGGHTFYRVDGEPALKLGESATIDTIMRGENIPTGEPLSHAVIRDVILYEASTAGRVGAYLVLKRELPTSRGLFVWDAARHQFSLQLPVGELVAERGEVRLHRDQNDAAKLRWAVGERVSPAFSPDDLLPCCTGMPPDITSWYWNPRKAKLYKLNNIAAPHASQEARTPIHGMPDSYVRMVQRYSAPHNRIIRELVLTGELVPEDHSALSDSERRRILSPAQSGEEVVLTTAKLLGGGSFFPVEFVVAGERVVIRQPVPDGPIRASVKLRVQSVDTQAMVPGHDDIIAFYNRGELYRGTRLDTCTPTAGAPTAGAPTAGTPTAEDIPAGRPRTIAQSNTGVWYTVERLPQERPDVARIAEPDLWAVYHGGYLHVLTANSADRAHTLGQLMGFLDPRTGRPCDASGDLITAAVERTLPIETYAFDGDNFLWHRSLGPPPGERVRYSGNPGTTFVPACRLTDSVTTCSCCGTRVAGGVHQRVRVRQPDGADRVYETMCGMCGLQNRECSHCHTRFPADRVHWGADDVCRHCYQEHYGACSMCGNGVALTELDRHGVCRDCRNARSRLRDYSFRPTLVFHNTGPTDHLHFGAEIEVEAEDTDAASAAYGVLVYPGCKNFLIAKRDGSLNNGAEFVTQPFTWEWFKQNKQRFIDIFGKMQEARFRARSSCGLHIHASRSPHTSSEEFRIMQLVYEHPKEWLYLSKRAGHNRYCQLMSDSTAPRNRLAVARARSTFGDRYLALNPTNRDTLEWRLWAGVSDFNGFAASLALTAAAHAFVKTGAAQSVRPKFEKFASFVASHDEFGPLAKPRLEGLRCRSAS